MSEEFGSVGSVIVRVIGTCLLRMGEAKRGASAEDVCNRNCAEAHGACTRESRVSSSCSLWVKQKKVENVVWLGVFGVRRLVQLL